MDSDRELTGAILSNNQVLPLGLLNMEKYYCWSMSSNVDIQ
jgi:hypothetical protein